MQKFSREVEISICKILIKKKNIEKYIVMLKYGKEIVF